MQNRKNSKQNTALTFLFLLIFMTIVFCFMLADIFPIEIELKPAGNDIVAQIHKKSIIPPFNDIDIKVQNLRQAKLGTSRSSKGGTTYRVELVSYNGNITPITTFYSSGYRSKEWLMVKINDHIKAKTYFRHKQRQPFMFFFGSLFFSIPLLIMIAFIKQGKKQNNLSKQAPQHQTIYPNQHTPQTEEEKYKGINDSIIK